MRQVINGDSLQLMAHVLLVSGLLEMYDSYTISLVQWTKLGRWVAKEFGNVTTTNHD